MNTVTASCVLTSGETIEVTFFSWANNLLAQNHAAYAAITKAFPSADIAWERVGIKVH